MSNLESHKMYLHIARVYADKKSKCQFTKVACIAVNQNDRIIATGVNGTLSKLENCCDVEMEREDHVAFTNENEIHAEENMILELARSSQTFTSLTIYTTISPCEICLKHILGLIVDGISIPMIVFEQKYHRTTDEQMQRMKAKAAKMGCSLLSIEEL